MSLPINSPSYKWDKYFMEIASVTASNSKCFSRQVGAVIVRDKSIVSVGYNGPPRNVPSCDNRNPNEEKECPRKLNGFKSGEGLHMCIAGHAERNAIVNAARNGVSTIGCTLICNCGIPCKDCLIEIINSGITEIVYIANSGYKLGGDIYYDDMSKYLVETSGILVRGISIDN